MMKKIIFLFFCYASLLAGETKTYTVDVENSSLRWNSIKVTGSHWGFVSMQEGTISLESKNIISGEFSVDMNSITNEDMGDSPWAEKLINHLKTDDFFDVANHPKATFKLTSCDFDQGAFKISGDLTIRGITHSVEFPAVIRFSDSGTIATGQIKIDRTKYNMKYRSGQYFPEIGDKMIYDEFTVDFEIKAN